MKAFTTIGALVCYIMTLISIFTSNNSNDKFEFIVLGLLLHILSYVM